MKRLRLVHPELGVGSTRTAVLLAALTWLPLFLFSIADGLAVGGVKIPFARDIAAHTRFLIAVPILVLADIPIGLGLRGAVQRFINNDLVRVDQQKQFGRILIDALRWRDSRFVELILIILVYVASYTVVRTASFQSGDTWFRPTADGGLNAVGYWYVFVAMPIFGFLIMRWLYRMAIWSRCLWCISKLDLVLTPTHPDGAGGIAFLGQATSPFGVLLFAVSAVAASGIATRILFGGGKLAEFQWAYLVLFVIAVLVFLGPLLIFIPKLMKVRQQGLLEYGTLASRYTHAFHRKWVASMAPAEQMLLGNSDMQALASVANAYQTIKSMRPIPAQLSDIVALVIPGLIPAVPLIVTVLPVSTILRMVLKLVTSGA